MRLMASSVRIPVGSTVSMEQSNSIELMFDHPVRTSAKGPREDYVRLRAYEAWANRQ
jgi:hypothetical protein